jgi:hypothetical protein
VSRVVSQWTSRASVALAVLLGAVVVDVLLVAGSSPATAPDLLMATLALLALAGVRGAAALSISGPHGPGVGSPLRVQADPPMPRGLPTDPAHHPIAPRAPGLA